jgi:hypothetical protein
MFHIVNVMYMIQDANTMHNMACHLLKGILKSLDSFKCQYCNLVGLEFIECDMFPKCVLWIHDIALANQNLKMHKIIFGLFLV